MTLRIVLAAFCASALTGCLPVPPAPEPPPKPVEPGPAPEDVLNSPVEVEPDAIVIPSD